MMSKVFIYSLIIICSVFIASISQILLKKSTQKEYSSKLKEYLNPLVIIGYSLFFGCTLINVFALKYVPLSLAPILESSGYIFVSVLGYIFLKERIGKKKFIGMLVILCGIFVFSI
jgi:Membrane transporters of cations and cationic drugs